MRRTATIAAVLGVGLAGLGCRHVGGKCDCGAHPADAVVTAPPAPYPAHPVTVSSSPLPSAVAPVPTAPPPMSAAPAPMPLPGK